MNLSGIFNFPGLTQPLSGTQTGQTNQVGSTQPGASEISTPTTPQQAPAKTDQADLSASGLSAALSASNAAVSDVRTQLVSSIQSALQAGTYNVPSSEVAGSLIQSMMGQRN